MIKINKIFKFRYIVFVNIWKIIFLIKNKLKLNDKIKVIFLLENADWAISKVGNYIANNLNKSNKNLISLSSKPQQHENKLLHFGSHYMWLQWYKYLTNKNKYVVSFFHGNPENSKEEKSVFDKFLLSSYKIEKIIVSNSIVKNRLIKHGIKLSKIILIPIGVDTNFFIPPTREQKIEARKHFNFKKEEIIIGSFQKDGEGWNEGLKPKMIKGPDIFLKVVEFINKKYNVKILLTGPARGYVINGLKKRKISFIHNYLNKYSDILKYYHALDFYLVTSREEGGPMGLLESMSTGVKVVTTNVGMAPDFIDQESGLIVNSFDPKIIAEHFNKMLIKHNPNFSKNSKRNKILKADWKRVANLHFDNVYSKILKKMK